jgi:hypothetical protein
MIHPGLINLHENEEKYCKNVAAAAALSGFLSLLAHTARIGRHCAEKKIPFGKALALVCVSRSRDNGKTAARGNFYLTHTGARCTTKASNKMK